MATYTRGEFLGFSAALAGAFSVGRLPGVEQSASAQVPGASDYTPGPFEPLMAIQSMVTRTDYKGRVWGANQKVSLDEALTIATLNGAYASSEENLKGSITAGKLADFVMLEKDPHDVPPNEIMHIKVSRTVVGGKTVYAT